MRLLICAGGTGGGVYPALAVLSEIRSEANPVLWVGSEQGIEKELVRRAGVDYVAIPAAGLHGVGMKALPGNAFKLLRGFVGARSIVQSFHPEALFFTGGYVGAPMALAARRIPAVLFVPDIEPGLALKFLARFADQIAVSVEETKSYFPAGSNIVVTGYPVRSSLKTWTPDEARKVFHLVSDLPVLLVFGGSKGARSINRALLPALPVLLTETQVIHISGQLDWPEVERYADSLPEDLRERYAAYPFLHERMGAALEAADLALSRAGASCLGEFPAFGLPAVLVPYPYAWRYQELNAAYLEAHGAAIIVNDQDLREQLADTVLRLMRNPDLRLGMRDAMSRLAQPGAAQRIAGLIKGVASGAEPRN